MIYNVRTQDEWDRAQAYSKGGHTDFGSLTLLFSQHVAGLQIRTPEGEWKWVKPVEGGITCNAADTLTFLTNGKLSSLKTWTRASGSHLCSAVRLHQIDSSPRCDAT
jgi:gibberellin 2-oxidase